MSEASIPVDLLNPGQVFACLGFLEAADVLLGDARGGFDWSDEADIRFRLQTASTYNPFQCVLKSIANAKVSEIEPAGWKGSNADSAVESDTFPSPIADHWVKDGKQFAGGKWSRTKLPALLRAAMNTSQDFDLLSWADASGRQDFKLYAGNRGGADIARDMLRGKRKAPTKGNPEGTLITKGIHQLYKEDEAALVVDPFSILCPLGGTFNMDPRGAWVAMDIGFSPNKHAHIAVVASPVVELLATFAMEHARPHEYERRQIRYAVWSEYLAPILARAALSSSEIGVPMRSFHFTLDLSGKNKIVSFAHPFD